MVPVLKKKTVTRGRGGERSLVAFSSYLPDGRRGDPHLCIYSMFAFKSRPSK